MRHKSDQNALVTAAGMGAVMYMLDKIKQIQKMQTNAKTNAKTANQKIKEIPPNAKNTKNDHWLLGHGLLDDLLLLNLMDDDDDDDDDDDGDDDDGDDDGDHGHLL